jgi:flagellar biosynthesis protein FlhG
MAHQRGPGARVLAVTSGKGGVGKTNTSVNLSIALAALGRRVILLDADLGLANVEVLMGLSSLYNIEHVIDGEKTMTEIMVRGPGGIHIVPGSSGLARVADLNAAQRANLLEGLRALQDQADYIILDTMAGIGKNAVAFATAADEILLVTTPEPHAIVDAYAMLKTITQHRPEAAVRLIVNMVANQAQGQAVATKMNQVALQYLSRSVAYLGYVPRDAQVNQAVMQSRPFILQFPQAAASQQIHLLARRLVDQALEAAPRKEGFFRRFAGAFGIAQTG